MLATTHEPTCSSLFLFHQRKNTDSVVCAACLVQTVSHAQHGSFFLVAHIIFSLTTYGSTAKLLEKEFIQLISKFWVKTRAKNTKKLLDEIEMSKKTANGPLRFMEKYIVRKGYGPLSFLEKYIVKKAYPQEVLLACLQWSQAYRQEYQTTCGNVLTSGDVLVILPGHNII